MRRALAAEQEVLRRGGLGSPLPHPRQLGSPRPHLCNGTGLDLATSAPELGSRFPFPDRDWAHPCRIYAGLTPAAGTGPTPAASAPGLGLCAGTGPTPAAFAFAL